MRFASLYLSQLPGEYTALSCCGAPMAFSYTISTSTLTGTHLYPWVKRSSYSESILLKDTCGFFLTRQTFKKLFNLQLAALWIRNRKKSDAKQLYEIGPKSQMMTHLSKDSKRARILIQINAFDPDDPSCVLDIGSVCPDGQPHQVFTDAKLFHASFHLGLGDLKLLGCLFCTAHHQHLLSDAAEVHVAEEFSTTHQGCRVTLKMKNTSPSVMYV